MTLDEIMATSPVPAGRGVPMAFYSVRCCWWTSFPQDLGRTSDVNPSLSLPCCPYCRSVLFEAPLANFIADAKADTDHYGAFGLAAFVAAHHRNGQHAETWEAYEVTTDEVADDELPRWFRPRPGSNRHRTLYVLAGGEQGGVVQGLMARVWREVDDTAWHWKATKDGAEIEGREVGAWYAMQTAMEALGVVAELPHDVPGGPDFLDVLFKRATSPAAGGGWLAIVNQVPGVIAQGATLEECAANAAAALNHEFGVIL